MPQKLPEFNQQISVLERYAYAGAYAMEIKIEINP